MLCCSFHIVRWFQFYDSPIKRMKTKKVKPIEVRFNSMIVRLKERILSQFDGSANGVSIL